MLDRYEHVQLKQMHTKMSEDDFRVQREVSEWAFNSHWWIEETPGVLKCKWCDKVIYVGHLKVEIDYPLCTRNPALKKLLEEVVKGERAEANRRTEANEGQHY